VKPGEWVFVTPMNAAARLERLPNNAGACVLDRKVGGRRVFNVDDLRPATVYEIECARRRGVKANPIPKGSRWVNDRTGRVEVVDEVRNRDVHRRDAETGQALPPMHTSLFRAMHTQEVA
jgi:hypothetical protein